jgi:hypothetical protein
MDIDEKRVFGEHEGGTVVLVGSATGVVRVAVAADRVGEFGLEHRCRARDLASDGEGAEAVAVATDDDVLVRDPAGAGDRTDADEQGGEDDRAGPGDGDEATYRETGFGPATAVGVDRGVVAAGPGGRIARRIDGDWFDLATVDGEVRAVDGGFVAASDGVYRATPDGLDEVGLADARDVAAAGPFAATGDGLYRFADGEWRREREGATDVVAAGDASGTGEDSEEAGEGDPDPDGTVDGRAHAAAGDRLFERVDGEWRATGAATDGPVAGVAHGPAATYAVTERGTLFAAADGTWRPRTLGIRSVVEVVVAARDRAGAE